MTFPLHPLRFGYDTYERHRLVASLIHPNPAYRVLDVGGGSGLLARFVPHPVTVTNLDSGDVISSGLHLPFGDDAFDIVTNLDVLEHVPPSHRPRFVAELIRVARLQLAFCVPLGSEEHGQKEREILALLKAKGAESRMLEEHVTFGLPSLDEIRSYLPLDSRVQFKYSGDFRFNGFLVQADHLLADRSAFKVLRFLMAVVLNLAGNLLIYPLLLANQPRRFTNRVLVLVSKEADES